jgi:hypothetical protein
MEIWKDIVGYDGAYKVSSLGKIKSYKKDVPIILKPGKDKDGYLQVSLSKNGKASMRKIHRKVTETFINNTFNKKCVNHINGIKGDNRVENLEWCTHKENTQHALNNGLRKSRMLLYENEMINDYLLNGLYLTEISRKYKVGRVQLRSLFVVKGIYEYRKNL